MKTKLLSILFAAAWAAAGCTPDEYGRFDFSNYTVDKVVCAAGSNHLVADGVSELDLNVTLYTKEGTYTDIYGEERDRYREIPRERWRTHDIRFYVNGVQTNPPYKTSDASAALLQCYAEVDGTRSSQSPAKLLALYPPYSEETESQDAAPDYPADPDPLYFEVAVRAAYTPPARRIPVIFHIIDLQDNSDRGQDLHASAVYAMVGFLNKVYGRLNSKAACGANPNLEFVPALRDEWGDRLKEPGINRIYIEGSDALDFMNNYKAWIWNLDRTDEGLELDEYMYETLLAADELPERTPRAFWDPDRYLNIWIVFHPEVASPGFSNLVGSYFPLVYPEGVVDNERFPIPEAWGNSLRIMDEEQLEMWKLNPYDLRLPPESFSDKISNLGQAGLFMAKSEVANYGSGIIRQVGAYFGLIPNSSVSKRVEYQYVPTDDEERVWLDDYCDDTPAFNRWFDSAENGGLPSMGGGATARLKYTVTPPYYVYRSHNVMESGSACSYVSQDQVRRMQWVLENAPARQMWRNTEAIE